MKNITNTIYTGLCLTALLVVLGCNPEDNEHFRIPQLKSGGAVWAKVDPAHAFFDVSDLSNTRYVLDLEAFDFEKGNLVRQYDIYVSFVDASEGTTSDTVFLKSATEFPSRVEITPSEIVSALNLPDGLDALGAGDFFNFTMEVIMKDGTVFNRNNTSDDIVLENNSRGTFLLSTFVGCPSFDINDLIGSYDITNDAWEVTLTSTTEVVAGPSPNQVIIKDAFGHGFDMALTLDAQGIATVNPRQNTWDPANYGLVGYGKGYALGNGRAFSCIGMITLDFVFSVDIGTYGGTWNYTIVKQ
jgi:hypothetical protein